MPPVCHSDRRGRKAPKWRNLAISLEMTRGVLETTGSSNTVPTDAFVNPTQIDQPLKLAWVGGVVMVIRVSIGIIGAI